MIHVVALGNRLPHFDGKRGSSYSLKSSWRPVAHGHSYLEINVYDTLATDETGLAT